MGSVIDYIKHNDDEKSLYRNTLPRTKMLPFSTFLKLNLFCCPQYNLVLNRKLLRVFSLCIFSLFFLKDVGWFSLNHLFVHFASQWFNYIAISFCADLFIKQHRIFLRKYYFVADDVWQGASACWKNTHPLLL